MYWNGYPPAPGYFTPQTPDTRVVFVPAPPHHKVPKSSSSLKKMIKEHKEWVQYLEEIDKKKKEKEKPPAATWFTDAGKLRTLLFLAVTGLMMSFITISGLLIALKVAVK